MAKKKRRNVVYYYWLTNTEQHTNAYVTYPGCGYTPTAAREAAQYYANQTPWTVVTPASRTSRWVVEVCDERAWREES